MSFPIGSNMVWLSSFAKRRGALGVLSATKRTITGSSICQRPLTIQASTNTTQKITTTTTTTMAPYLPVRLGRGSSPSRNTVVRFFQTESAYHSAADETLEDIQDVVEETLEDNEIPEFEITFASGVLTMVLAPHGTWVINKQTPNQQLWWSSPISGPRRYEYEDGDWVFTRDESHSMTLRQNLKEEIEAVYQVEVDL